MGALMVIAFFAVCLIPLIDLHFDPPVDDD